MTLVHSPWLSPLLPGFDPRLTLWAWGTETIKKVNYCCSLLKGFSVSLSLLRENTDEFNCVKTAVQLKYIAATITFIYVLWRLLTIKNLFFFSKCEIITVTGFLFYCEKTEFVTMVTVRVIHKLKVSNWSVQLKRNVLSVPFLVLGERGLRQSCRLTRPGEQTGFNKETKRSQQKKKTLTTVFVLRKSECCSTGEVLWPLSNKDGGFTRHVPLEKESCDQKKKKNRGSQSSS